jgi:RNA polymerase sigma factor FliA
MRLLDKGSWASPQTDLSAPMGCLTQPQLPDSAVHKSPRNPSAAVAVPESRDLLTAEQERVMAEHMPIVRFIARRIHERLPQHVPIEDLYSAGVLGLLDAFGRFDSSKQVTFRTYAQFRIRGAILDSLRTLDWSPRDLRRKGRGVEQAIQALIGQLNRSPTDIEIAQKLNIPLAAYQQLLGELKGLEIGTLHTDRSAESDEEELDLIPGRPDDDPLYRYLDGEMRERLTKAIEDLPARERLVLTLYYYEETAMKEIALILGVHVTRVSQIHASAVLHLRARLANPHVDRRTQATTPGHEAPPRSSEAKNEGYNFRSDRQPTRTFATRITKAADPHPAFTAALSQRERTADPFVLRLAE